ncbi:hypothetical protein SISSUDRAFT_1068047 [Sistotremastrum suecicum HHB10207 ss-3]|uniref:Uncharacterized protein n=1 Tax=Sistotremastrum suecicum HHB10207 ss-3 TaxID=1314776 RepID=A0A165WGY0_9AGAM|nr:hypothetical protein SISSUDRAFT_1068047 [Sistotremastrum suecicum HHB10207 ss-3]
MQQLLLQSCERETVGVTPGYKEDNDWTEEELQELNKENVSEGAGERTEYVKFDPNRRYHFEQAGVTHLVHGWVPCGHQHSEKAQLLPSAQMLGAKTAYRAAAVKAFIKNTSILHKILGMYLKLVFPEEWEKVKHVYDAGRWVQEDTPDGFALGRAVVWKLQIAIHRDPQDGKGSICVVFNCGKYKPDGEFGGGMAFPDLGIIFEYPPGSILMFRSADLYHGVMPSLPMECTGGGISTGRVSWVMFTTEAARRRLADKPPGWLYSTNGGKNEYQSKQMEIRKLTEEKAAEEKAKNEAEKKAIQDFKASERQRKRKELKRKRAEDEEAAAELARAGADLS